ncbi:hypothetical protein [Streptomyces sp. AN091965]|uniref:hypothetical protein n=1 Tax=Streptomyces sp. AN091965 TaxID=2927803 RepID=UPI001F6122C3|nr:hypothetical protein [Streptomyces sp. AN091965]MCI3929207.1 hypothetical protein [Streptomyces sp. AN091965]
MLDSLNPASTGIPLKKRVLVIVVTVVVTAAAVAFGVWVEASGPVADRVQAGEEAAQDRADSKKPPFAQTDPTYFYDWFRTYAPRHEWILDRALTGEEARELSRLRVRGSNDEVNRWARSIGARPVLRAAEGRGEVRIDVQLRGTRTQPVVINNLSAQVEEKSCRSSKAVTRIVFSAPGGFQPSAGDSAHLVFDLDTPKPTAVLEDSHGGRRPYVGERFEYLNAEGAPSGFIVQAFSLRTCEWTIEADWEDATGSGTFTIDDNGKSFTIENPNEVSQVWVQDVWTGKLLKSPAWFGQPEAKLTTVDRYYRAWDHYRQQHRREPNGSQLSAALAAQNFLAQDERPTSPGTLRRHFREFCLYSLWSYEWRINGGAEPSADDVIRALKFQRRDIHSLDEATVSSDEVERHLPEFRRRHQALAVDEAKGW